ncbi:TPA: hypothetical protein JBK38_04045 [Legionella pneumophila]|nr:hypothetical protein [Legionella pneumophila]
MTSGRLGYIKNWLHKIIIQFYQYIATSIIQGGLMEENYVLFIYYLRINRKHGHNLILMIYISDKNIKFINIEKSICI